MQNRSLVLDLVKWIAGSPRLYDEVMDAWRTSCPQLTIWEDAVDAEFVKVEFYGSEKKVLITGAGRRFLLDCGGRG